MTVEVVHEPDQWPSYPVENCCMCRKPTRYWYGTGATNVALCPPCAADATPESLPTKKQWLAQERAKAGEAR